MNMEAITIFGN